VTIAPSDYERFEKKVSRVLGIDLSGYRTGQLLRRLEGYLVRQGMASLEELAGALLKDARQRQDFSDFITINVSEFFRDPEKYTILEEEVLPTLLAGSRALEVWSAGCSVGAEPYSIAMLLDRKARLRPFKILATDIDAAALQVARSGGPYAEACVRNVPEHYRRSYLREEGGRYWVVDALRSKVTFQRHDLLKDPFGGPYDLIVCRNVVIYFTSDAKDKLYREFARCLKPGGFLFVGPTEILLNARSLGLTPFRSSFYRKAS
jgi:chemotaxis protein methyltransferase CheR